MVKQLDFGNCLNELLMLRSWSAAKLSKEINIDSSYVRRWIRGERVPSLKSNYIEQISSAISSGLEAESKKPLREAFIKSLKNFNVDISVNKPLFEYIKEALLNAQIYSLKLSPEERQLKHQINEQDVINLLELIDSEKTRIERIVPQYQIKYSFSNIPMVIKGRQSILNAIIALVREAIENGIENSNEILLSFQSEKEVFDGFPLLHQQWEGEITRALKLGWNIRHLWRLNKNVTRSLNLVESMVEWIGYTGRYEPIYFNKYGTINPANELVVIPGIGALLCFAADNMEYIDTAFFYHQEEAVASLSNYFKQLSADTSPLLTVFNLEEYHNNITEKDKKLGDHLIVRGELDSMTFPYSLWDKYLHRTSMEEDEINKHLARIQSRIDSFYRQIERYKFKYMCSIKSIEHMITFGSYMDNGRYKRPQPEDISEHLSYLIYLLKKYDNFEVALIDIQQSESIPGVYWEVKGEHTVAMDIWSKNNSALNSDDRGLYIVITEGTIAGAFKDYFIYLWDKITPKYRDKEYIIAWLEEKLEWYENSLKKHSS